MPLLPRFTEIGHITSKVLLCPTESGDGYTQDKENTNVIKKIQKQGLVPWCLQNKSRHTQTQTCAPTDRDR